MAFTGILFRRGLKTSLTSNPPRQGEIVFATDTYELGMLLQDGTLSWKKFNQLTSADLLKLDGIEQGANNYVLPSATQTVLGGITAGDSVIIDANGKLEDKNNSHQHSISNITNLQTALDSKQNILESGVGIKTINGESILGSGDISTVPEETITSLDFDNGTLTYTDENGDETVINVLSTAVTSLNGETGDITLSPKDVLPTLEQNKILTNDGENVVWTSLSDAKLLMYGRTNSQFFTPTSTTNTINIEYSPNEVHVYLNGIKLLKDTDFTANDGQTIILAENIGQNDNVEIQEVIIDEATPVYTTDEIDTITSSLIEHKKGYLSLDTEIIDEFDITEFMSGEYNILVSGYEGINNLKVMIMHDNFNAYSDVISNMGTSLGTFDYQINDGKFQVLFTPDYESTQVQFFRKLLTNAGKYDVKLPEDLMTGSGVIDLMNDDEIIDLDFTFIIGDLSTGNDVIDLQDGLLGTIDLD